MFTKKEIGTREYEELKGRYAELFRKYGYTVTESDRESLMVENGYEIGAFTIREDMLCAGAFYPVSCRDRLLAGFEKKKAAPGRPDPRLGCFFYSQMNVLRDGSGNHDFSIHEIEWMLKIRAA